MTYLRRLSLLSHVRGFSNTAGSNRHHKTPFRSTLSSIWVPTGLVVERDDESGHDKLIRAGFLRQSQSGIFHILPLGERVQAKIEKLLDETMQSIGASKVSLSSITSEELWRKSGRLDKVSSELFRLKDRKDIPLMLGPTHEEEITNLVARTLKSYKDLPIKLYQTTRKYRDEMRPRNGLLRSREFLMKDLYTFDLSIEDAHQTYHQVSEAYETFFSRLKLPIIVAEASSGDMGGNHSHEYHLSHAVGSDTVFSCNNCGYAANDEVAVSRPIQLEDLDKGSRQNLGLWRGISKDRKTLVNAWYPRSSEATNDELNLHAIKSVVPDLDTAITSDIEFAWDFALSDLKKNAKSSMKLINIVDSRMTTSFRDSLVPNFPKQVDESIHFSRVNQSTISQTSDGKALNLLVIRDGDRCPRCESGSLKMHRALELGHTFVLGTRYSRPLGASVTIPQSPQKTIAIEMGCYGIGISRIFGAIAEHMADNKGLNWPRDIAPFEIVVIPTSGVNDETIEFFDMMRLSFDAVLDDRKQSFGWRMQDADMAGYPVTIVLGKGWNEKQEIEVQCRRLSVKEKVPIGQTTAYLKDLLTRL